MGIEFEDDELRALVEFFHAQHNPAINEYLGFTMDSPDLDNASLKFEMRDELIGNYIYRTLHGGVISAILDITGGHVVFLKQFKRSRGQPIEKIMKKATRIGTIDIRIDYLLPGTGNNFSTSGYVLRIGNKVAVTRMELHNDRQELIAVGTGSYTVG